MRKRLSLATMAAALLLSVHAEDLTGTLRSINARGIVTIGYRESSIPFSYLDQNQKPVGYAIDLCHAVVNAIKHILNKPALQVKLVPVTPQTRIPLMVNGTIDMECGSTTNTKNRERQVAFSDTYYVASVRMAVKANSGIKSLADLNGKVVVTTTGTTSDRLINQTEQGQKLEVRKLYGRDHAESFLMVQTGRATAFVMDDILLASLIAESMNPKEFAVVGPALSVEPYGIMMRKDDPQFKALVDDTLVSLYRAGTATKLYNKWFMSPIPPKGVNINLPMSDKLKASIAHPNDAGI